MTIMYILDEWCITPINPSLFCVNLSFSHQDTSEDDSSEHKQGKLKPIIQTTDCFAWLEEDDGEEDDEDKDGEYLQY